MMRMRGSSSTPPTSRSRRHRCILAAVLPLTSHVSSCSTATFGPLLAADTPTALRVGPLPSSAGAAAAAAPAPKAVGLLTLTRHEVPGISCSLSSRASSSSCMSSDPLWSLHSWNTSSRSNTACSRARSTSKPNTVLPGGDTPITWPLMSTVRVMRLSSANSLGSTFRILTMCLGPDESSWPLMFSLTGTLTPVELSMWTTTPLRQLVGVGRLLLSLSHLECMAL
mmetsp:Transcript_30726/g.68075  ORF Transcript_30726/g.68075 Transcript_30726/m.68075 type:complete len:225 (+) Transcript_30726:15-689(+)